MTLLDEATILRDRLREQSATGEAQVVDDLIIEVTILTRELGRRADQWMETIGQCQAVNRTFTKILAGEPSKPEGER